MTVNYNSRKFESCMISIDNTLFILEKTYRKIKTYDHLLDELNISSSNIDGLHFNKFRNISIYCNELTYSLDYSSVCFVCRKNCYEHLNSYKIKDEKCRLCEHNTEQHAILQQKFKMGNFKIKVLPDGFEDEIDNQNSSDHNTIIDFLSAEKKACRQFLDEERKKLFSSLKYLEKLSEKNDFFKIIKEILINPRNNILEQKRHVQFTNNEASSFYKIKEEIECSKEANRMVLEIIERLILSVLYFL
jgi:hypothetical protein